MRKGVPYAGAPAGCAVEGYVKVSVDGTQYKAHHVIWCWMTGEWPNMIDHRDLNGENNAWHNLRESTLAENNRNVKVRKTPESPSPLKGAYFDKRRNQWHSRIVVDGRVVILGSFDSDRAAHNAYCVAAQKYHGEFARAA